MSHPGLVRPVLVVLVLVVASLGLVGCGCCDDDYEDVYGGTLRVVNSSASTFAIDRLELFIPGNPTEAWDLFLLPGEDMFIDLYPADYVVELFWSDGLIETFPDVAVWDDELTTIIGENF
jgi:hypothetical protein